MRLAGCGLLHTRWPANPLTGLVPLGPFKKVSKFSKKNPKIAQKVPHKDFVLRPGPYGDFFFKFFQNFTPFWGCQQQKNILRLPTDTSEWPMPNLVEIHKVVWPPNPNKQTNKQTDRHLSFIYRYIDGEGDPSSF